jgi:hypothetical protein
MLEERGLPTTLIALVLSQAEKVRPPRALMVPFMLGRPFGEPNDVGFQKRVLLQALALLTQGDGPVLLAHFPDDPPSTFDRPGWLASVCVPKPLVAAESRHWESAFRTELASVLGPWERFKSRFDRTTVGLSGLAVDEWPAWVGAFLDGGLPCHAQHETPALSLRFLVDDIKALYGEAAQADGEAPSARQIDLWFWRETLAGELILALRTMAMASENTALKTVGGRFFVPAPYVPSGILR